MGKRAYRKFRVSGRDQPHLGPLADRCPRTAAQPSVAEKRHHHGKGGGRRKKAVSHRHLPKRDIPCCAQLRGATLADTHAYRLPPPRRLANVLRTRREYRPKSLRNETCYQPRGTYHLLAKQRRGSASSFERENAATARRRREKNYSRRFLSSSTIRQQADAAAPPAISVVLTLLSPTRLDIGC